MNLDPHELEKFDAMAAHWWDPAGPAKPLHQLNPVRMAFISARTHLQNVEALDVGCGGGILTESLTRAGAQTWGIDMAGAALDVAKMHAIEQGLTVQYQAVTIEQLAINSPKQFDVITCMEMLEHVPDPAQTIRAIAQLTRTGGDVFLSTLNRHPKAYLVAILGAEYLLNALPKGTHDYAQFIRPAELAAWCRESGLQVEAIQGVRYHPLQASFSLSEDVSVNYLMHCRKVSK